jgi:hypothetical protein
MYVLIIQAQGLMSSWSNLSLTEAGVRAPYTNLLRFQRLTSRLLNNPRTFYSSHGSLDHYWVRNAPPAPAGVSRQSGNRHFFTGSYPER